MHAVSIYWMSSWFKKKSYFLVSGQDSWDYCICPQQSHKEEKWMSFAWRIGDEMLLDPWQFRVSGEQAYSLKSSGEINFCVEVRKEAWDSFFVFFFCFFFYQKRSIWLWHRECNLGDLPKLSSQLSPTYWVTNLPIFSSSKVQLTFSKYYS